MLLVAVLLLLLLHGAAGDAVPFPFVTDTALLSMGNTSVVRVRVPGGSTAAMNFGYVQDAFFLMSGQSCVMVGATQPLIALSQCTTNFPTSQYPNTVAPSSVARLGDGAALLAVDSATWEGGEATYVFHNVLNDRTWSDALIAGVSTAARSGAALMRVRVRPTSSTTTFNAYFLMGGSQPGLLEQLITSSGMPQSWSAVANSLDQELMAWEYGSVAVLYPAQQNPIAFFVGPSKSVPAAATNRATMLTLSASTGCPIDAFTPPTEYTILQPALSITQRESYIIILGHALQVYVLQLGGPSGSSVLTTFFSSGGGSSVCGGPMYYTPSFIDTNSGTLYTGCSSALVFSAPTVAASVVSVRMVSPNPDRRAKHQRVRVVVGYESMPSTALLMFARDDDCVGFTRDGPFPLTHGTTSNEMFELRDVQPGDVLYVCVTLGFCPAAPTCSDSSSNVSYCLENALCLYDTNFGTAYCCGRQPFPGGVTPSQPPSGSLWMLAWASPLQLATVTRSLIQTRTLSEGTLSASYTHHRNSSTTTPSRATMTLSVTVSVPTASPTEAAVTMSSTLTISSSVNTSTLSVNTSSSSPSVSSTVTTTATMLSTSATASSLSASLSAASVSVSVTRTVTVKHHSKTHVVSPTMTPTASATFASASWSTRSASPTIPVPFAPGPVSKLALYLAVAGGSLALLLAVVVAIVLRRRGTSCSGAGRAARLAPGSFAGIGALNEGDVRSASQPQQEDERLITRDLGSSYTTLVNNKKYTISRLLGKGGYGMVFLAIRNSDQRKAALKYITCRTDYDRSIALREFEVIMKVKHPNMIAIWDFLLNWQEQVDTATFGAKNARGSKSKSLVGSPASPDGAGPGFLGEQAPFQTGDDASTALTRPRYVAIVTPYYTEGDLKRYCSTEKRAGRQLSEERIVSLFAQITTLIVKLHDEQQQIVHRDLKPENILLDCNFQRAIVTDFGLAFNNVNEASHMTTQAGSLPFVAPECWSKYYNYKVDIWSLGCMLYAVCTQRVTGEDSRVMFNDVDERWFADELRREVVAEGRYSMELYDIMMKMLTKNPLHRPTAHQCEVMLVGLLKARGYDSSYLIPTPLPRPAYAVQREEREDQARREAEERAAAEAQARKAAREARKQLRSRAAAPTAGDDNV